MTRHTSAWVDEGRISLRMHDLKRPHHLLLHLVASLLQPCDSRFSVEVVDDLLGECGGDPLGFLEAAQRRCQSLSLHMFDSGTHLLPKVLH